MMIASQEQKRHVGAAQTLAFVQSVAQPGDTILEAGCGNGILASHLIDAGFRVTAIDSSKEAVEEARAIGVAAEHVDFLEYTSGTAFDVVLLSRSLHHMRPIDKAVKQAESLVKSNGLLLLEDFGAELLDMTSAVWFYGLKAVIQANGNASKGRGPALEEGSIPTNCLRSWQDHHFGEHGLAESSAMRMALGTRFHLIEEQRVPYLYRYLVDNVPIRQGEEILHWESVLCNLGIITPIGVRVVARKRNRAAAQPQTS